MSRLLAFALIVGLFTGPGISQPTGWFEPCPPATLTASLRHVHTLSATNAVAFGQDGVYRSTNGGLTWEKVYSGSWFYDGQFFDANNGIAVGSQVLKTTDGGQTWNSLFQPSSQMYACDFISPTTGWAVTSEEILKTTDGGTTWSSQFKETELKFLEDVVFLDANTGIAVGGPSYGRRTTDGGQTWNPLNFGSPTWVNQLAFVSPTVGYAAGMSASYISITSDVWGGISISVNGVQSTVWKTTDAGATWGAQVFNTTSWLRGLQFVNAQTGWIVGDAGFLGRTTDSGTTWQKFELGTTKALHGVSFTGQNGLVAGNGATLFASTDNGSTWAAPRNTRTNIRIDGLFFFDELYGFAATAGNSLIKTTDGGQSWQLLSMTVHSRLAMCFWNREKGWLADGNVSRTTDGGVTWKTEWGLNASGVHFPTSSTGWIVGWNGLIAKTTRSADYGSWVQQVSGTTNHLTSVWFVDEQTGWAVGEKGTILRTTDGGEHWQLQGADAYPNAYPPDLRYVKFLDQKTGWATGYSVLLRTNDGGETWQYVEAEDPYLLNGRTGWAIPFFGRARVARTDDGGNTWRTDAEFESMEVYPECVEFVNDKVGWIGASDGRILKTVSGGAGYRLFFPWLRSDNSNYTGFAIANPNDFQAGFDLQAFGPPGQPMYASPTSMELLPNQQIARVGTELFPVPAGTAQQGWVELSSDAFLGGLFQFGGPSQLDGAPPVSGSPQSRLLFTRVYEGSTAFRGRPARTLITIVNPGSEAVECRLELYSGNKSIYDVEVTRSLPAHGQITETITELFGQDVSGGFIKVTGSGLIGFAKIELTADKTAIGLNAASPEFSKSLYSGQMAEVQGLFTSVKLINTSYNSRVVTLTAIDNQGHTLAGPVDVTIEGNHAIERDAKEIFGFTSDAIGTLKVDVDVKGDVLGDVIFGDSASFTYAAGLPLQTQPFRDAIFNHVAEGLGFFTGLALYVPGPRDAEVTVSVFASDGTLKGTTTFTMATGTRLSRLVSELVEAVKSQVGGYVRITSTEPLIGQELFGYPQLMSAVPPTVLR